jgi:hypothetical protein
MLAYGEGIGAIGMTQIAEVARDLDMTDQNGRLRQGAVAAPVYRTGTNGGGIAVAANDGGPGPLPVPIPILERYPSNEAGPSKLKRLAGRLGLGSRA